MEGASLPVAAAISSPTKRNLRRPGKNTDSRLAYSKKALVTEEVSIEISKDQILFWTILCTFIFSIFL